MPRLRFEAGLLLFTVLFGLVGLLTTAMPNRSAIDPSAVAIIELGLILAILAYLGYHTLRSTADASRMLAWAKKPLGMIDRAIAVAMAVPLYVVANFQLYGGRFFLKAGELPRIGIEPVLAVVKSRASEDTAKKRRQTAREAA